MVKKSRIWTQDQKFHIFFLQQQKNQTYKKSEKKSKLVPIMEILELLKCPSLFCLPRRKLDPSAFVSKHNRNLRDLETKELCLLVFPIVRWRLLLKTRPTRPIDLCFGENGKILWMLTAQGDDSRTFTHYLISYYLPIFVKG